MKWTIEDLREIYELYKSDDSRTGQIISTLVLREIKRREKAGRKVSEIPLELRNRQYQRDFRERQKIRLAADNTVDQIIREATNKPVPKKKRKTYRGKKKHLLKKKQGKPTVKETQRLRKNQR